jgi:HPt (histidine-containing phosphotransfer) domain-containing protein
MQFRDAMVPEGPLPSFERPIDLVHLARQTLGDPELEREVLGLFVVQARAVIGMLGEAGDQRRRMELAHTLKGSARSVGAWRVAADAEGCEAMIAASEASWRAALDRLAVSIREAIAAIGELSPAH